MEKERRKYREEGVRKHKRNKSIETVNEKEKMRGNIK